MNDTTKPIGQDRYDMAMYSIRISSGLRRPSKGPATAAPHNP